MKKNMFFLSAFISSCVIAASLSANLIAGCSQPNNGPSQNLRGPSNPPVDNQMGMTDSTALKMDSVEKFKGTITSVNRIQYPNGSQIQIMLQTDRGVVTVILGPASYVEQAKIKLQEGDQIRVKGYRVRGNGEEVIIAQEVDKNGNLLKLRDDQRHPLWRNP